MPADIAEAPPAPGQIAFVRQRRYLVESVVAPPADGEACLVSLSCLDDDAQGEPLRFFGSTSWMPACSATMGGRQLPKGVSTTQHCLLLTYGPFLGTA